MTASHRLAPRTAMTVEHEDGAHVVYLSYLPTARIVVAPSPGAEIILGSLGREAISQHPDAAAYLTTLTEQGLLVRNDAPEDSTADELHVLVSVEPSSPWLKAAVPVQWQVLPRPTSSGPPITTAVRRVRNDWELIRRSSGVDIVVLTGAGHEVLLLAVLQPLLRCAVVVHNPVRPKARSAHGLFNLLHHTGAITFIAPRDATLDPVETIRSSGALTTLRLRRRGRAT